MYTRGNRVFYDSFTGRIIYQTGFVNESTVPMEHEDVLGAIVYKDLNLGSYDPMKQYIERIDRKTGQPIFKDYL